MNPLVSIIVPVYKVENYISMCLDSICAQTYKNLEIILVDDGSPDSSALICQEYAVKDSRIHVIHQENKGLASARNTGLRSMTGEYFYFVDSDDCIHPQLIETVVKIAESENANLVQINIETVPADFSGYNLSEIVCEYAEQSHNGDKNEKSHKLLDDEEDRNYRNILGKIEWKDVQGKLQKYDLTQSLYNLDKDNQNFARDIRLTTTVAWTKLYKTSAYKSFQYPEGMRMHEDQMVAHRVVQMGGGMVFLDMPMYFYRQSAASLIRVGWTPKRLAILDCYEDRLKCCEEIGNKQLVDYIFERYLVCMFRNYNMVNQKMQGEEKIKAKKEIYGKMKALYHSKRGIASKSKKIFFETFFLCPGVVTWIFCLRNK